MSDKLVVGCGYLGSRVAALWRQRRHGPCRYAFSPAPRAAADPFRPVVAEVTQPCSLRALPAVSTILFAVGFDRYAVAADSSRLRRGPGSVLASLAKSVNRFIYISSTGVYSQSAGELIDEQAPCEPQREGGRACLEAEKVLKASRFEERSFSCAWPAFTGQAAFRIRRSIRAGEPLPVAADAWLNLIHVEDAARIIVELEKNVPTPATFNVSDGHPIRRADFYRELARLLSGPRTGICSADNRHIHRQAAQEATNG